MQPTTEQPQNRACRHAEIAASIREALAERVGVGSGDSQLSELPTVAWGLDSLDFVVVLAGIESTFGVHLEFPSADLHDMSLAALSDRMAETGCNCATTG